MEAVRFWNAIIVKYGGDEKSFYYWKYYSIIPSAQSFQILRLLNALKVHSSVLSLHDCSHVSCILSDMAEMQ